jgi:hypothetical protein
MICYVVHLSWCGVSLNELRELLKVQDDYYGKKVMFAAKLSNNVQGQR